MYNFRNARYPIQPLEEESRIMGGEQASIGEYPYIVAFMDQGGVQMCAGSILDEVSVAS